ncbi:hypothetical protein Q7P37_004550 [Cladosporium fusiforme]
MSTNNPKPPPHVIGSSEVSQRRRASTNTPTTSSSTSLLRQNASHQLTDSAEWAAEVLPAFLNLKHTMTFVPKSRRAKFDLTLHIHDLNNVPLVTGSSFVRWHLPSSRAAEHRGRTHKCPIKDHRVQYDYEQQIPIRLTVSKEGMLQEYLADFEVQQEYSTSGKNERITLGKLKLNLAEYVEASENQSPGSPGLAPEAEGVVRRYLMQDSKINSTLKIGIHMRYVEGTRDFTAPPLRTAPVFGGIAGIISSSEPVSTGHGAGAHANSDNAALDGGDGPVPSLSVNSREAGEMQDMYRRTLAAYWSAQPGELKADEAIEDIFAGGDGWGRTGRPPAVRASMETGRSGTSTPNPDTDDAHRERLVRTPEGASRSGFRSKHAHHGSSGSYTFGRKHKAPVKAPGEVDEFEIREDLKNWRIGESAWS